MPGRGARNRAKTHCPQGHPYDDVNTWVSKMGVRQCRICWKERQQRIRERDRGGPPVYPTPAERFWPRVSSPTAAGCWEWIGRNTIRGYGAFTIGNKGVLAHRYAYTEVRGPIPDGLVLDHLCRNTLCVNPWHLEPVTIRENARRGLLGELRSSCSRGHQFTNENTYFYTKNGQNRRVCRVCARLRRKAAA